VTKKKEWAMNLLSVRTASQRRLQTKSGKGTPLQLSLGSRRKTALDCDPMFSHRQEPKLSNPKLRRDRNEIFAEILKLCMKPTAKTHIMYKTNISYGTLLKFLKQLEDFDFLTLVKSTRKYATTPKGQEYLTRWGALQELIEAQAKWNRQRTKA
jgi:predicted transcriptional regulator